MSAMSVLVPLIGALVCVASLPVLVPAVGAPALLVFAAVAVERR